METTHDDLELAIAFEAVSALSTALEEEAEYAEEVELRMTLFVAEANGEVVTSAPPPWARVAA